MVTTQELARYEAYFNNIMKAIVTLKGDLELAEQGWKIHIAIDFAELFAFAFPFTQVPHLVRQPNEPATDIYSREQATLAFLFSKWKEQGLSVGNLILLPPYVEELRASLSLMQLKHFEAYSWLRIINTLQKRAFGGSFAQIRDIVEEYRINRTVPKGSKARTAFTCYVESQYSDVVSLLTTTDTRAGLSVLRAILNMGVLSSVQDHFTKNYPVQLDKILDLKVILADKTVNQNLKEWLI